MIIVQGAGIVDSSSDFDIQNKKECNINVTYLLYTAAISIYRREGGQVY